MSSSAAVNTVLGMHGAVPARSPELVICPLGDDGRHVVKHARTGEYFHVGPQEAFLLEQFDGQQTSADVCRLFEDRFGQPLPAADLEQFVALAAARGLLAAPERMNGSHARAAPGESNRERTPEPRPAAQVESANGHTAAVPPGPGLTPGSLLYWRKRLLDPDPIFSGLAPRLWFIWTPAFLLISSLGIVAAALVAWSYSGAWINQFPQALRWETLVVAWIAILLTAVIHECAHGLTCKHFGGEVREVGFLLILLMPGLYCNVSDAWMFREKSKRLWVTFAGAYCDLVMWALAVAVWRLTLEESFINYLAWIVIGITGIRTLFNLLPLLKLDGYYLLSDALEIPNLRERSLGRLAAHVRWLLWGAPRPRREPRGNFLLAFGLGSWVFSIVFLGLMLWGFIDLLRSYLGSPGLAGGLLLGTWLMFGLVSGFSAGEASAMVRSRRWRTAAWVALLGTVIAVLSFIVVEDRYGGPFTLHPAARAEIRAPVAGFVADVDADQGQSVAAGETVARLEVPGLASKLDQKRAELREAEAELRLLESGTRAEEIAELESRAGQSRSWKSHAEAHLTREESAVAQQLERLDQLIVQRAAEMNRARNELQRNKPLMEKGAISLSEYELFQAAYEIALAQWKQAQSERRAVAALGAVTAERELFLREHELATTETTLTLKKLGPRDEELEAARARLSRIRADLSHLEELDRKQLVPSPLAGMVITPRLKEKIGRYVSEGELICDVEDRSAFEVEIRLAEEDAARIAPGRRIGIKLRALPYDSFPATVLRIAPAAIDPQTGESQSRVPVYCRIEQPGDLLRSQMTGYGRVYCDERSLGAILLDRGVRLVRTEFWW
jgi:putative peptide zinc metalloprotease protein